MGGAQLKAFKTPVGRVWISTDNVLAIVPGPALNTCSVLYTSGVGVTLPGTPEDWHARFFGTPEEQPTPPSSRLKLAS
jgi:hypothetical protein